MECFLSWLVVGHVLNKATSYPGVSELDRSNMLLYALLGEERARPIYQGGSIEPGFAAGARRSKALKALKRGYFTVSFFGVSFWSG